jgi:formylglycine-generating enzyme required for sulfatase activity
VRRLALTALLIAIAAVPAAQADAPFEMVDIPGGTFEAGDPNGEPDEAPHAVTVQPFKLMRFEVTNAQFAAFVEATGHVTDPERRGFGYVWPGRWTKVEGADWQHRSGPASDRVGIDDHPVVQVSWQDAGAFCQHYGLRLPNEEEWEFAARGDDGRLYPWGMEPPEASPERRANYGRDRCCAPDMSDGFHETAPVGSYPAGVSPFDLHDMAGNVWEWTSSPDGDTGKYVIRGGGWGNNPYCLRASYRHKNPPDIGLDMVGFRCAGD